MHLLIPFAAPLSDSGQAALGTLALPRLATLLARWTEVARDAGAADTLSPPHERALATAWGWPLADGLLPLAAVAAADDGIAAISDGRGWALLSPTHWHTATDHVAMADPDALALDEAGARALFAALQPLFGDDGWSLHWGTPKRWYARHGSLVRLPTASLDRVAGRSIQPWLNRQPEAQALRRLQAEVQMLLHSHPLNTEREERGLLPVNSFWASGTGATLPVDARRRQQTQIDSSLRGPALADDWSAWAEAWRRIDAGPLRALLDAADAGQPAQLTLCGERSAATWAPQPLPLWRRWLRAGQVDIAPILSEL